MINIMILVAHRGNTKGPNPEIENNPEYILQAIANGFYVEVDVWYDGSPTVGLGHDAPQYYVQVDFLQNPKIIAHAKTPATLEFLLKNSIHCFSHDKDDCVLTSMGWIWTYPGKELTDISISVMPEWIFDDIKKCKVLNCKGVCSDFVAELL